MTFEEAATFLSLVAAERHATHIRSEGLDQVDLEAVIIEGRRLDLDVDIDATDQGELFAFVQKSGATFCISKNSGTYYMINGKDHVVAESDDIREVLAALS